MIADLPPDRILRRRDLASSTDREIARLVRGGVLVRARRGVYLRSDCAPETLAAVRAGGRTACLTALEQSGVFVQGGDGASRRGTVHAHVPANASRLGAAGRAVRLHWMPLARSPHPASSRVEVIDALLQSAACQPVRALIASIDSALQLRLLHPDDLDVVFARLPRRLRRMRRLVDGRAESGPETLVRLMLRVMGETPDLQVRIRGVGRVDLMVAGWLVIECDSAGFHSSWAEIRRDRRRDQALAALGYVVYRPIAEDILFRPDVVVDALRGLLTAHPRRMGVAESGRNASRRPSGASQRDPS